MPSELDLVFGSHRARHLIIGHSQMVKWKGVRQDGTDFGEGLDYGVFSRPGATLSQLLEDVGAILAGWIPEEDKAARICIVQVCYNVNFL